MAIAILVKTKTRVNYLIKLDDYKQQIANLYSDRSSRYDNGDWHPQIAHRLVEYAQVSSGQHVLDIATGTGMVAIEASQIVGTLGKVVGIDIRKVKHQTRNLERCYYFLYIWT